MRAAAPGSPARHSALLMGAGLLLSSAAQLQAASSPYGGTPWPVPGNVEVEDFDVGGLGVAYHDTTAGNAGGVYRTSDSVDIANGGTGRVIGWVANGEWLSWTIAAPADGAYNLVLRHSGPNNGNVAVLVDGATRRSGITVPSTGSYSTYVETTLVSGMTLTAGTHLLRLNITTAGFNLDRLSLVAVPVSTPYSGTPVALPGLIEAENFDLGTNDSDLDQLGAWYDTTPGNAGGNGYRSGVDVDITSGGTGNVVGWITAGEWMAYSVTVATAGEYQVAIGHASGAGSAALDLLVNGSVLASGVALPSTGSYNTYGTTQFNVTLAAGSHVLKARCANAGYNLDFIQIAGPLSPPIPHASPYEGVAAAVPGTIQAERFDAGVNASAFADPVDGANFGAYADTTAGDSGATGLRSGDVDLTASGTAVGDIADGEWLAYSIQVAETAEYDVQIAYAGITDGALSFTLDGAALSGSIVLPATTGTPGSVQVRIPLTAGSHRLKVLLAAGNYQLDALTLSTFVPPPPPPAATPYAGTPYAVPGLIEAEHFDAGVNASAFADPVDGANFGAYADTTVGDSGATGLRSGDVDLALIAGGAAVDDIADGEWLAYSIQVAETAEYDVQIAYAGITDGALSFTLDGAALGGSIMLPATTGTPGSVQVRIPLTAGSHRLKALLAAGDYQLDTLTLTTYVPPPPPPSATPFEGIAYAVPGLIEAEHFDAGANASAFTDASLGATLGAYFDTTPGDSSLSGYRTGTDVDLLTDGPQRFVTATEAGEWLAYSIDVNGSTSQYQLTISYRANGAASVNLELDGAPLGGTIALPATGGAAATVQTLLTLPSGPHRLKLLLGAGDYNINSLTFAFPPAPTSTPYGGVAWAVPGVIEAENFDEGGQGLAFSDSSGSNLGGQYRDTAVDISEVTDTTAVVRTVVSHIADDEWLQYTIAVPSTGGYDIILTGSTSGPGHAEIRVDGAVKGPSTYLPFSGATTYRQFVFPAIKLPAGERKLRLNFKAGLNVDSIQLVSRLAGKQVYRELKNALVNVGHTEFLPDNYFNDETTKHALLIFLPGGGERGNGNLPELDKVCKHGPSKLFKSGSGTSYNTAKLRYPGITVAPQTASNTTYSNSNLLALLDYLEKHLRVDPNRVYITGLCMGGSDATEFVDEYPDRVIASVPIIPRFGPPADVSHLSGHRMWLVNSYTDPKYGTENTMRWADSMAKAITGMPFSDILEVYPFGTDPTRYRGGHCGRDQTAWIDPATEQWTAWQDGQSLASPTASPNRPLTANRLNVRLWVTLNANYTHGAWGSTYDTDMQVWQWLYAQSREPNANQ